MVFPLAVPKVLSVPDLAAPLDDALFDAPFFDTKDMVAVGSSMAGAIWGFLLVYACLMRYCWRELSMLLVNQ
eukprot:CAMPEP_0196662502 /NCGR_PEP_ID=MMETSP1086-20130531/49047_1 /TAXON_ID=77921 /ORGANISM="Cyanoptyche  gloeocystis , Strain SAG4.97" /LENGTH=71 /DNA_ID=CAMNT_0041997927 /DNA_START=636 /DNA_END=851 /DNA_ORIENTATION=-